MPATLKRRKPNQKRARETREKLLEAAQALLISEGFASLTSRRLAKQAGISVGSIYDYFPSMQALLFWIYEARLNKRLQLFDELMMGENLERPLKEAFPVYLAQMEKEHMWSRIDLELHKAAESDAAFKHLITDYEDQLSDRYCALFKARGSTRSDTDLQRLALYIHGIDHTSLRLQLGTDKDGRAFYGDLTVRVDLMLMQQAGILTWDEAQEIANELASR